MKGLPTDGIASAPAFSVTLDKRAVTSLTVALEPAAYRFSVTAPAWAYVMLDDDPRQRPVRLEHDARGYYVLVLGDNSKVRLNSAATALLDCSYAYRQVSSTAGMKLAIEKARQHDIGMMILKRTGPIGRLGECVTIATQARMMGTIYCIPCSAGLADLGGHGQGGGVGTVRMGLVSRSPHTAARRRLGNLKERVNGAGP